MVSDTTVPPRIDLLVWGPTFFDLSFSGLDGAPVPGREVWAEGFASGPGGVATTAIGARRLGLSTTLASRFGDDDAGRTCRAVLEREGVDLLPSVVVPGIPTPVTVALAIDGDRAMISHGPLAHDLVPARLASAPRFALVPLRLGARCDDAERLRDAGTHLLACGAWDPTGQWRLGELPSVGLLDTLVVNQDEAHHLTGLDGMDAARALLEFVPRVVVTQGAAGAVAATADDAATVPGIPVTAVDPTGAGDVFLAGLVAGLAHGMAVADCLRLAGLAGALSVTRAGSGLSAPHRRELREWLDAHPDGQWDAVAALLGAEH